MTVTYGFYDSLNGDRTYNTLQFSSLLDSIINDGVFISIGDALAVSPGTGLHVTVGLGRTWFDHTWTYNDSILTLDITTPHAVLDRIDTVVLETNSDSATRANSIKIINGTPASSPVPPTLEHTSTLNQYPLADLYIGNQITSINSQSITNRVGTSDCPFVTGILESINIDFLFSQWQDDFETWFQFLQDELDENQAANLQAQILEHDHSGEFHTKIPTGGLLDGAVSLLKLASSVRFQKLYEFIGDSINQLDWNSIPNDFTHLLLIYNGLSSRLTADSDDLFLKVNGDGAANYYTNSWLKTGPPESVDAWNWSITNPRAYGLDCGKLPSQNIGYLESGSGLVLFPNYKGTILYKQALAFSFYNGAYGTGLYIANTYWRNTAAINRLTSYMDSSSKPRVGSIFSFYGFN